MTAWTADELTAIGEAAQLRVATRRDDGTLRDPVTIWVVPVGDDLYVRAYKGADSPWFRGLLSTRAGRVEAGGVARDVTFADEPDPATADAIDAAYRDKYRGHARYVDWMVTAAARAATVKLVPR